MKKVHKIHNSRSADQGGSSIHRSLIIELYFLEQTYVIAAT